jgi:hypothetical protein
VRRSRATPGKPRRHKPATVEALIALTEAGVGKAAAARQIGIDPATLWRWTRDDPQLAAALADADKRHQRELAEAGGDVQTGRPRVAWHPSCPFCASTVVVRTARGQRFWKCLTCGWRSWRPRARGSCPACNGYLLWAHSRLSIACATCRRRWPAPSPAPAGSG